MLNALRKLVPSIEPQKTLSASSLVEKSASAIAEKAPLTDAAKALVQPQMSTPDFVKALQANKMNFDAVPVLAKSMPETKAVDWACKSCELAAQQGKVLSPESMKAIEAAQKWIAAPGAESAKAALEAASAAPVNEPGAWSAFAAAWSREGSEPPPDPASFEEGSPEAAAAEAQAAALPPEQACSDAVANAVKLAALKETPDAPEVASVAAASKSAQNGQETATESKSFEESAEEAVEKTAQSAADSAANEAVPEAEPQTMDEIMKNIPEVPPEEQPELSPKELAALDKALKPFVDLGIDIANS